MSWEPVDNGDSFATTHRLAVPGGWLYSVWHRHGETRFVVLVPEPTKLDGEAVIQQANRLYDAGYAAAQGDTLSPHQDRDAVYDGVFKDGYDSGYEVGYNAALRQGRDWEIGHKAGYMQALANHEGDKVTPDRGFTEHTATGDNLGFIARKKPSNEEWTKLYTQIEELLPDDGVIDDSSSLINAIAELIQKREGK